VPGTVPPGPLFRSPAPHFLQNNASSTKFSNPQPGQIFPFASVMGRGTACTGGASGEPHRSQNRDCRSEIRFPHFWQVRTLKSRAPHRLQKTDASSGAGVPQVLHRLRIGVIVWILYTAGD
jgi:hypothetical protein